MKKAILLFAVALVCGLGWMLVSTRQSNASSDRVSLALDGERSSNLVHAQSVDLARVDSAPTSESSSASGRAAIPLSSSDALNDAFESKYAGRSLDELRGAEAELMRRLSAETVRIGKSTMDEGKFEERTVAPGESIVLVGTSGEETVASSWFSIGAEDGSPTVKIAEIRADEHPEFHALQREVQWVGSRVRRLDRR